MSRNPYKTFQDSSVVSARKAKELIEHNLTNSFMEYKGTTIKDMKGRNPYVPFLVRNLSYVKMDKHSNREKIEEFIDKNDAYPSFWLKENKPKRVMKKASLRQIIEFLGEREAFNEEMQKMTATTRSFSLAEMADYSWRSRNGMPTYKYHEHTVDHTLMPVEKRARSTTPGPKKRKQAPQNVYKKNVLFPVEIDYRLCSVIEKLKTREPILNGISCTHNGEKVLRCIFCERQFKTLFHLLFHCNMSYPRLQFIPVFNNAKSKKADYVTIDIINNPFYDEVDEVSIRKCSGTRTNYLVFPRDKTKRLMTVPMDPAYSFFDISGFNFVYQEDVFAAKYQHPHNLRSLNAFSAQTCRDVPNVELFIHIKREEIFDFIDISYVCKIFMFTYDAFRFRIGDHRFNVMGLYRFTKLYHYTHQSLFKKFGKQFEDCYFAHCSEMASLHEGFDDDQLWWLDLDLRKRVLFEPYGNMTDGESVARQMLLHEILLRRMKYAKKLKTAKKEICMKKFPRLARISNEEYSKIVKSQDFTPVVREAIETGFFPENHIFHRLQEKPLDCFKNLNLLPPTTLYCIPEWPEEDAEHLLWIEKPEHLAGWIATKRTIEDLATSGIIAMLPEDKEKMDKDGEQREEDE